MMMMMMNDLSLYIEQTRTPLDCNFFWRTLAMSKNAIVGLEITM